MPETEARRRWTAQNTTYIPLKLNNRTDADILSALEEKSRQGKSRQGEIKRLIRRGLEKEHHEPDQTQDA